MEVMNSNIKILSHPIINNNLAIIRDKNSDCEKFKNAVKRITYMLIYEASKELPTINKEIETPLEKTICKVFDDDIQLIIAPILRAGMICCEVAQELLPVAYIDHIGMYRNEQTLEPVWYYDKRKEIKQNKEKVFVIILDPMLATGNSAIDAIKNFTLKGIIEKNITFVSLISSPEGIKKVSNTFKDVKIITSAIDRTINNKGYILPGLGDAGDRIYNTIN